MHIDAGQISRIPSGDGVDIGGGERLVSRPRAVIPPVTPHRLTRVDGDVVGDDPQALFAARGGLQIQSGELESGGG